MQLCDHFIVVVMRVSVLYVQAEAHRLGAEVGRLKALLTQKDTDGERASQALSAVVDRANTLAAERDAALV